MALNWVNHKDRNIKYEAFIITVVAEFVIGAIIFLHNSTARYRIGETKPFIVTVFLLNGYIVTRMVMSGINIYLEEDGNHDFNHEDLLKIIQFVLILFGIFAAVYSCALYLTIAPIIYQEQKESVFVYLEAN